MWMGKQLAAAARLRQEENAGAELGVATMGGAETAVLTRGEERRLPLFGPGGMIWRPKAGDTVLVIKGGSGREEACIAGVELSRGAEGLQSGEICLYSAGGASICLRNNGRIEVTGELYINGSKYGGEGE